MHLINKQLIILIEILTLLVIMLNPGALRSMIHI